MTCTSCSRNVLNSFISAFVPIKSTLHTPPNAFRTAQFARFHSAAVRLEDANPSEQTPRRHRKKSSTTPSPPETSQRVAKQSTTTKTPSTQEPPQPTPPKKKMERWQIQKAALKEKLGGEAWNPRKKLSPDTMEGIRHLHFSQPERFTLGLLADHFKVSPEAVRRILKSKWRPSEEEQEERLARWDKRGERIWSNLVELGVKPPKRWREMGVGRAARGQVPKWKSRGRNSVAVNDSMVEDRESIIPFVDGSTGERLETPRVLDRPLRERL
ncbi:hypothetical protein BU24DRAFT_420166 [Aaosphaeria arxii CBS 175.79]|uniref:Required for respiratory growth protein 9, mitochondrial n=1 Tax=Aaosphaeria arxii CBS 175.79 TaxID=1450172 RepID=A0A6A5XV99_9PLEO|nr:uncharacterized protein BU24DRAFT_420166 [Aaosphaeria arxii CBS 175.79]KAF2017142.1 hypothetical protein BU24DRAFT_420166 [Aaosphaeria arxii CBS 175.79]